MGAIISTSESAIRQTLGKASQDTIGPGLTLYVPFVQKILRVSNKLQQDDFMFTVKTANNVFTKIRLSVQYRIEPQNSHAAIFSLGQPKKQIEAYVENIVRSMVPTMTLDQLFASPYEICKSVSNDLTTKIGKHGFTLENTLVTEINPDEHVIIAMNKVYASEQLLKVAQNEAQAKYVNEIKAAEADREKKRMNGEGLALQRTAILEKYGDEIKRISDNLGITPTEAITFTKDILHLDVLQEIGRSSNAKVLFVDKPNFNSSESLNTLRNSIIEGIETKINND